MEKSEGEDQNKVPDDVKELMGDNQNDANMEKTTEKNWKLKPILKREASNSGGVVSDEELEGLSNKLPKIIDKYLKNSDFVKTNLFDGQNTEFCVEKPNHSGNRGTYDTGCNNFRAYKVFIKKGNGEIQAGSSGSCEKEGFQDFGFLKIATGIGISPYEISNYEKMKDRPFMKNPNCKRFFISYPGEDNHLGFQVILPFYIKDYKSRGRGGNIIFMPTAKGVTLGKFIDDETINLQEKINAMGKLGKMLAEFNLCNTKKFDTIDDTYILKSSDLNNTNIMIEPKTHKFSVVDSSGSDYGLLNPDYKDLYLSEELKKPLIEAYNEQFEKMKLENENSEMKNRNEEQTKQENKIEYKCPIKGAMEDFYEYFE